MSFLFPKSQDGNSTSPSSPLATPPPIPPTLANPNVKNQSAQARAAAAAAAGKVGGFGKTVDTSSQGAAPAKTATVSLFGT